MKGFDCNTKLDLNTAQLFKSQGFDFVIRYVGRTCTYSMDIDSAETANIMKAGLKLAVVQHCLNPDWVPDKASGSLWGQNAALYSKQAGYKAGCIVYLDLEGIKTGTSIQTIIDFCNAWYDGCLSGGYTPGIYVGYNVYLTGDQLYNSLKFQHYWKSLSTVPMVSVRGYEEIQSAGGIVNGIEIDNDVVTGDNMGNVPIFMVPDKVLTHTISVYNDGSCEIK